MAVFLERFDKGFLWRLKQYPEVVLNVLIAFLDCKECAIDQVVPN